MKLSFGDFNENDIGVHIQLNDITEMNVPAHTHDFFEIVIVVSGGLVHSVNHTEQQLKAGEAVFIRPNDEHYYKKSIHATVINIAFTEQVMRGFELVLNSGRFSKLKNSSLPMVKAIGKTIAENIKAEITGTFALENNSLKWELIIKNIIYKLICYGISEEDQSSLPNWLNELIVQMEKPENFIIGTKRLYEIADKTPEHISRQFHKYLNLTPTEYINQLRINFAKNQLMVSNEPIISICFSAGFENLNYFYRLFKLYTGSSPLQYRNTTKAKII